jgi:hypothetical protein
VVSVGLVAWPWNLALSASESAQAARPDHGAWSSRGHRARQINRFMKSGVTGCALVEPDDFDESEEGGVASPHHAWAPGPPPGPTGDRAAPECAAHRASPFGAPRTTLLCRLRC